MRSCQLIQALHVYRSGAVNVCFVFTLAQLFGCKLKFHPITNAQVRGASDETENVASLGLEISDEAVATTSQAHHKAMSKHEQFSFW
ncbi:MAG TPA: hypothetical protein VN881_09465 [Candidatus Acidoferrales bacterium]|nr:hypothetical protein [Candidatus Acidoferrales bacterium]